MQPEAGGGDRCLQFPTLRVGLAARSLPLPFQIPEPLFSPPRSPPCLKIFAYLTVKTILHRSLAPSGLQSPLLSV